MTSYTIFHKLPVFVTVGGYRHTRSVLLLVVLSYTFEKSVVCACLEIQTSRAGGKGTAGSTGF